MWPPVGLLAVVCRQRSRNEDTHCVRQARQLLAETFELVSVSSGRVIPVGGALSKTRAETIDEFERLSVVRAEHGARV